MKNFALMSAIALTSAVGLTACSSSEDATNSTADVNPTYDGSSVRTDFAFNVTKASQGTTRMTAAKTQNNNTFLGMSNMYLFPFTGEPAANKSTNLPSANPNYSLGDLTSADITTTSPTTGNSKKIYSLTLPIGTNNFLFYGTATRVNTETNFAVGKLNSSLDNTVANTNGISFSLSQIATDLGADATNLAAYLTKIAQATDWAGTVSIVNGSTSSTNPDAYVSLADLYTKFTTIYTDRCGSAEAIKRTIIDLYKSAKAINGQSSVTDVQTIATAICTAITATTSTVHMTIADSDADPENWTFTWVGLSDETFPAGTLKLPMGAVQLVFDGTSKTFSYKPTNPASVTDLSSFGINYTDICYPSELVYFDNSPLRATDVYKKAADYSSTPENWDKQFQDPTTGGWAGTSVGPSTRAVAMQNNVNYGVSMLESTVMLQTANLTDNRKAILGGSATDQTDIAGTGMQVTGILIGGQPGTVGWNMVSNSSTGFGKIIYDNDVQYGTALSTTQSASNYTIVLDNLKGDGTTTTAPTDAQDDVNFALQIKNGNKDFYGKTGMIPAGSTFYLVGSLSASSPNTARVIPNVNTGSSTVARNTVYRITHEATNRVFVQDYKTTANITINTDALKNAYSTIPDLRSTELLFGLSVDLSWEVGAIYNVTISGN